MIAIEERRRIVAEFDALVTSGKSRHAAGRLIGHSEQWIDRWRSQLASDDTNPKRGDRIDLGLALLSLRAIPGEQLTREDIAAWCDCSPQYIESVETKALRKVRNRLWAMLPELREEFDSLLDRREAA